ncbi:MAG: hypothetical protein Kow0029_32170 [Candidatus Rifleibacteriota bacterium]
MFAAGSVNAFPEELKQSDIRQEILQKEDEVNDFLKECSEELNKKMGEEISSGKTNPQDMESIKAALQRNTGEFFIKAAELRKKLKEPEQRLKLDMEMMTLAAQSGDQDQVIKIIKNWKGETKEIMIVTSAQRLNLLKVDFSPEFDLLLKEATLSKDPQVVKVAERMLNEFYRNPVGKPFPEFPAGMKTTDGKDLSLARFKGKILLVDFWATWCPPCRAEVPNVVKAYENYKDKGFEIVGISFDEDREKLDSYTKENKMSWPQYFDGKGWGNLVGPTYGIQSIPTMYLLDKDGKVITQDLRNGKLEEELAKLFK